MHCEPSPQPLSHIECFAEVLGGIPDDDSNSGAGRADASDGYCP